MPNRLPDPPSGDKIRLPQLDILRGVAILLVLGRHPAVEPAAAGPWHGVAGFLMRFGWTGVDLFFVLSGFLIGGLLFAELHQRGALDVRRFLIRRGFKIWPSYYVYLLAIIPLLVRGVRGQPWRPLSAVLRELLPNFFHVQNLFDSPRMHTWSLAVEEHFYLALPLLLLLLTAGGKGIKGRPGPLTRFPMLVLGAIITCTTLRCLAFYFHEGFLFQYHFTSTPLRIDSLAFGVLLAYYRQYRPDLWASAAAYRGILLAVGLALIAPMTVFDMDHYEFVSTIGFTMLYLGYGAILTAFVTWPEESWRGVGGWPVTWVLRFIAFIGFYSYPIYLWHVDVARPMVVVGVREGLLGWCPAALRWPMAMSMYVLLALWGGLLMGRLIERPALALRDRLFPRRADVPGPTVAAPSLHAVATTPGVH